MLQSDQLKQDRVTIGIDKILINSAMYEHRCLENINKLYTSSGKCKYQQQYKSILETAMVFTPERFTDNSPMSPGPSMTVINPSAIKSLRIFTAVLDIKSKTAILRVGASK